MNILQQLLDAINLFEDGKIDQKELLKIQNHYIKNIKHLQNQYEISTNFETKNKISKQINKLIDKHILIFD